MALDKNHYYNYTKKAVVKTQITIISANYSLCTSTKYITFFKTRDFTCWLQSMAGAGLFESSNSTSKRSSLDRMTSGPPQVTISGVSGHIVQYNALNSPISER